MGGVAMNKQILFCGAVLLVLSCSRVETDHPAPEMKEWTFTAPATKASLAANGAFSWNQHDEIAVWDATTSAFVKFSSETGNSIFTATAPTDANFTDAAYYPYSSISNTGAFTLPPSYDAGDSDNGAGILAMYAAVESEANVLHFKHQCAYLMYQIPDVPATVTKIEISGKDTSNESVSLSGDFIPVGQSGVKEIKASTGEGTVTVNYSLTGKKYMLTFTIPVPVGTYAISYKAYEGDTECIQRHSDPISFQRAHLYKLYDPLINDRVSVVEVEAFGLSDDGTYWNE